MNEYQVTIQKGIDTKTEFVMANSAAEIQRTLEDKLAYEMEFEGVRIKEIKKV